MVKRHSSNVSKNTFIRKDKQIFKLTKPFKHQPHKIVKYTQTIRRQQPTNCLIACDRFVGLALKGLNFYKKYIINLPDIFSFLINLCHPIFRIFVYIFGRCNIDTRLQGSKGWQSFAVSISMLNTFDYRLIWCRRICI